MHKEDKVPKGASTIDEWYNEAQAIMFEEFDDVPNDPPSGTNITESFDKMIRRKTNKNLRKLFGEDG